MNIDRLRYFAAVVETKNLRRAAELIGITPGSLSKALSTLKDEVGVDLLRPEGRGIEITDHGMRIYRSSAFLLEEFRRFKEGLSEEGVEVAQNKFRFGTFEVFSTYFASEFIDKELPDAAIKFLELSPGAIEKAVLDRVIDFGITYLPAPDSNLLFTQVGEFKMGVYGSPLWRKLPFEKWNFAVPTTAVNIHSQEFQSLDLWPSSVKRNVKFEFELLETALQTTRMGLSVMHCPAHIIVLQNRQVRPEFQLVELPRPKDLKQTSTKVFLVSRKDNLQHEKIEKKLAKFFRSMR